MRKLILTVLLLTFHLILFAQEKKDKISLEFKDINRKTALQNIEQSTNYKFYFDPEWLENENSLISGSYINMPIEEILEAIFNRTSLNFFIDKNTVILTNNSIIYDKLPENYFGFLTSNNTTKVPNEVLEKPIFHKEYNSTDDSDSKKNDALTLIGKETKNTDKKLLILSGQIKNSKTGEPVPNLTIRVKNNNSSAVTNNEGYYTIQLSPGVNIVETESLNHIKVVKKLVLYNDGKLDLNVDEKSNILDEVIINTKLNNKIKSTVTGLISIDIESIKNVPLILGERDIFKVATTLPGIKTTGEGSAGYNVRGGKEDQNLILLDNAVLYNPAHFFGFFSSVNPFTTKKADIYKGSIPAEFGGRLSSVFDITSKKANMEKLTGEGGIGPVTSNLSIGTPIIKNKSSLLLGGRATYSGWILRSLEEESLKNSEASFYDGIIKYNHDFNSNNSLESTVYYSHDAYSVSSDSVYKYSNRLASLKWDHTFNAKNKGAFIFTNSEYKFNINYENTNLNSFDFGYKLNDTQLMLKLNYLINDRHKLSYGISSKLYNISPGDFNPKSSESLLNPINIQKERGLESAVYLSDNFKVSDKLLIDVGLRYSYYAALGKSNQRIYQEGVPLNDATVIEVKEFDRNEVIKTYGGIEPRIAARYFLTDDFSVKASYDKTNQYIHLLSSNTTQSPTDTWKLSDLNVRPQRAQQLSLGFYKNVYKNDLELSLEGYYKKTKDILDYKVAAQLLLNENIETELLQGEGKAYGVELLLKKEIGKLNGWIGYTYSRTFIKLDSEFDDEKVNNGEFFPANFDKPHEMSIVMNYKITKRYSISSNFIYQTGRPITFPIGTYTYGDSEYTLYSDRNMYRIPDYYRLDIGVNIEGNHKIKKLAHSFWNISVYNILGRNNPYSVYFVTDDGKIKAYKTSIFSIPVPTITYNFKF
ncbi:TonB-dependent receptor [Flavobacterium sp.]|uniref:TonB-dependent receptor n=1 Tax=Flavobacterium sp. TaxID=239 RepID=UPI002B4B57AB|nr:TonB-dependent receptor [Flavobacterium sp.]HLF52211.1 TonB-dependent receptor [Flavobacterium sp.]